MGWLNSPGNILLLTSVPFFAGAYFGYRMPTEQLEDLIQGSVGGTADGAQQKMPKTKCQKIDGVFDHLLLKMCRIIQQNFIDF